MGFFLLEAMVGAVLDCILAQKNVSAAQRSKVLAQEDAWWGQSTSIDDRPSPTTIVMPAFGMPPPPAPPASKVGTCWLRYDCKGVSFIMPFPAGAGPELRSRILDFTGNTARPGRGPLICEVNGKDGTGGLALVWHMRWWTTCTKDCCRLQLSRSGN